MNNKIIEEALVSIIRRIEVLEEFNKKYSYKKMAPIIIDLNMASPGQIKYIRMLGGNPENLTKDQARDTIDRLLKDKEIKKIQGIVEPKEVDTDEAGLDGDLM